MTRKQMFDNLPNCCEPVGETTFLWSQQKFGFGQVSFYVQDGKVHCRNETMSKQWIKQQLCQMVDNCILDDEI